MKLCRFNVFIFAFIVFSLISSQRAICGEGVEIQYSGLSPSAQQAVQNMAQQRTEVKKNLEDPYTRLKKLKETYKNSCGEGRPSDSGCRKTFNQIIDAYSNVLQQISSYIKEYKNNLKVVTEELEPKIKKVAYRNSPSDLNEDIIKKYENQDTRFNDKFAKALTEAFGLQRGQTPYENASSLYLQYKDKLSEYSQLDNLLQAKLMQAQRQKNLAPLLNEQTRKELAQITNWISGGTGFQEKQRAKKVSSRPRPMR